MNHFNLLPPEIIEFIFKKLNLDDLINLRIVDKRFKQICEQIKIKQLNIIDSLIYQDRSENHSSLFWFYTNDPIYFNNTSVIEFSKFPNYATIFQLNKYLKRLALNIDHFNFSILNEFKLLEQLQITTDELIKNYELSLDHLKIADLYLKDRSDFKLTFNTIQLFAFKLESEGELVFKYPKRILFFEINFNSNLRSYYNNCLKKMNNLECLKVNGLHADLIGKYILSLFKNLKILDLTIKYNRKYNNLIGDIKYLINEKENLKRSELEIYFHGVKLINQDKINELKWSRDQTEFNHNLLEFQIKNYDLLKDNCNNYRINYCYLIKLIEIPSSFTIKFPFIQVVKANRIDNEDQFTKFLNNLQYLSKLELINCGLTKSFYEQLIYLVYLNDLEHLTIEEKQDLEINFNFILQLKNLKNFHTNQIIVKHVDLILKLFKQNQNIRNFFFKFDTKNYIKLYKHSSPVKFFSRFYTKNHNRSYKWTSQFKIESFYLDHNLKKVDNFSIEKLKDLDDIISILKGLKIYLW